MTPSRNLPQIALVFEGSLAILAALLGWCFGHWPLPGISFDAGVWRVQAAAVGWGLVATAPLCLSFWIIERVPIRPLQRLSRLVRERVVPLFRDCTLMDLALIALCAGVGEEMLFRGLIQDGLTTRWSGPQGLWLAIILAALVFGVCHMLSVEYFVVASLIGLYLGVLLWLTGNLLAPIVAHGLYDFLALIYLLRGDQHQNVRSEAEI